MGDVWADPAVTWSDALVFWNGGRLFIPTTESLLDLTVGQRSSHFRFDLLDTALGVIGTLDVLADQPVTVENNINRTIKRTMSNMRLTPAAAAAINPFADRVRPTMVLENGAEFPLGVMLFGDLSTTPDTPGYGADGGLVDQTLMVDDPIVRSITLAQGANVAAFVVQLLADAGVVSAAVTPSPVAAGKALTWPIGTHLLAIINACAELLGYYSLFFDNAGTARMIPVPELAYSDPDHVYAAGGRVFHASQVASDDTMAAANRFVVIDTGATLQAIYGVYHVPAGAPHSYAHRGFYVTEVKEMQGLPDSAAALAAATAIGQAAEGGYAWLEFSGAPDPRHDTFGVVEFDGILWREQEWHLPLVEGGAMRHKLRRVYV